RRESLRQEIAALRSTGLQAGCRAKRGTRVAHRDRPLLENVVARTDDLAGCARHPAWRPGLPGRFPGLRRRGRTTRARGVADSRRAGLAAHDLAACADR